MSEWTVETLKEYMDQRFADNDKAVQAALVSQEKLVAAALVAVKEENRKTELAQEKRFDSVNEFRNQQKDIINTFLPRLEYNAQHKALEEKVTTLTARMNQDKGQEISMSKIYAAIGAVGAILGILVLLANGVFN